MPIAVRLFSLPGGMTEVMAPILDGFRTRGLLEDMTSPDLEQVLSKPVTVYAGFDPTSSSLQVGNLAAIMLLSHFQRMGHHVIALVGGATAMIGDPSGKDAERLLLDAETVRANAEGVRENLSRFLDFEHPSAPARLVNNSDWLDGVGYIEFLRDIGKHFRMGTMLGRESVRARLSGEAGMSYTEFSYQVLQAYDFLKLYDEAGCRLQVGGSDQWGNITAGIDLVRRLRGEEVYGLTLPLICDSAGQKFGKSEGNAIYLDSARTSVYDFYQFFLRTEDADVVRLLKVFTFLEAEDVASLEATVLTAPGKREAQQRLAAEVTRAVHGEEGLKTALRASEVLFGGAVDGLDASTLLEIFADVASTELTRSSVDDGLVIDVAASTGLCQSKSAARRLLESGGLYVNNRRVDGIDSRITTADLIDGHVLILRSGKKNFHLVRVV